MGAIPGVPLTLVGAVVELKNEELAAHREACKHGAWCRYDQAVAVYLGDQEVVLITHEDVVMHDGRIIIDETVALWLSRRLT